MGFVWSIGWLMQQRSTDNGNLERQGIQSFAWFCINLNSSNTKSMTGVYGRFGHWLLVFPFRGLLPDIVCEDSDFDLSFAIVGARRCCSSSLGGPPDPF